MKKEKSTKSWVLRFNGSNTSSIKSFEALVDGSKTVETRAGTDKYQKVSKGDILVFVCGKRRFQKAVKRVHVFPSIDTMVKKISMKRVNPWVKTLKEFKDGYYSYTGYKEKIKKNGIIAFYL